MKTKVMMLIIGLFVIAILPAAALCEDETTEATAAEEESAGVIEAAPEDTGPPFVTFDDLEEIISEDGGIEDTLDDLQDQITALPDDTSAATECDGTDSYLDGEGNCDTAFDIVTAGGGGSLWTQIESDIYYSTGNVGMGTTSPSAKLEVMGEARISRITTATLTIKGLVPTATGGTYITPGAACDVYVYGDHAYVADNDSGLQIIDISTLSLTGSCDTPGGAIGVYVTGGYAYVVGGSGLHIIDISNPSSPTLIGSCNTPGIARGVHVSGNYAYVADYEFYDSGLQIIDISNPSSPTITGSCDTLGEAYGVYVVGNYAYVACYTHGIAIINISNPSSPTPTGYTFPPGHAYDIYVSGYYAYLACYESGLQIIDITNPSSPTITGSYDTPDKARGIYVSGDYAYVADFESGLQIVNISNPSSPTLIGNFNTPGLAIGVYASGDYAYVADAYSGLQIIAAPVSAIQGNAYIDGSVGIGTTTPEYKLDVVGDVRANAYHTGDIFFQKEGQELWRMFEDEDGLYVESIKTGKVYKFVLQEVEDK